MTPMIPYMYSISIIYIYAISIGYRLSIMSPNTDATDVQDGRVGMIA